MFQVYFGRTAPICQVEGFDEACVRSVRGALHVRPNTVLSMTEGELEHLKKAYPHLMLKARVIASPPKAAEAEKAKEEPKEAPKAEVTAEMPALEISSEPSDDAESSKRSKRKS